MAQILKPLQGTATAKWQTFYLPLKNSKSSLIAQELTIIPPVRVGCES